MEVPGSLLQAMQTLSSSLAVLVLDECGYLDCSMEPFDSNRISSLAVRDVTAAQQKVMMLAQTYNCPIAFVQYDINEPIGRSRYRYGKHDSYLDTRSITATHTPLRALLPMDTIVFNKHGQNAFNDTSLLQWLRSISPARGAKNIVVMGFHANKCIPVTIGPATISRQGFFSGFAAVDYKFTVLTCQKVLNGPPVTWANKSNLIKFYSHL